MGIATCHCERSAAIKARAYVATAALLLAFASTATAKYSGGSGEPNDPYQIATAADLIALGETPGDYDKHFVLTADIDLDPKLPGRKVFDKAVIAPDMDPVKWDFQGTPFTGVFDGNGQTISHLKINGASYLGLFGQLASGAEVKNLGVVDVNITGSRNCVGAVAGYNSGAVAECYSDGAVSGGSGVGGLVGWTGLGSISNCYSTGTVSGSEEVGGLVGFTYEAPVTDCYSTGTVSGTGQNVGGLVGGSGDLGPVSACFWDTQTSGQARSAGGMGRTTAKMQRAATFLIWGTCGNAGIWTIDEGNDYPRLSWENRPGTAIRLEKLSARIPGTGTKDDPFCIYMAEELNIVGLYPCEWDKHFKLMADVDMSGFDGKGGRPAFNVIGTGYPSPFAGIFDGNGPTISHLTINGESWVGLFGLLTSGAEVKNLGLLDVNMTGSGDYVGGLVGENYFGIITASYSSGSISGTGSVGGLVGYSKEGRIATSYSSGTVIGTERVGGLVGGNGGDVTQCFWDTQTSGQTTSAAGTGKTTVETQTARTFIDAGWDFVGETANGTEDIWWILEGKDYPRLWWEAAKK